MSTVVGVFEAHDRAKEAIEALEEQGFSEDELSIVARQNQNDESEQGTMEGDGVGDGIAWGGGLGAVGGILAGLGALAIPGIGPIVAAGPIAAGLSGAVAGGIAGGLIDLGIPEAEGQRFEEDVKEGRLLAVVECEGDDVVQAEQLLQRYGADEVQVYD